MSASHSSFLEYGSFMNTEAQDGFVSFLSTRLLCLVSSHVCKFFLKPLSEESCDIRQQEPHKSDDDQ